MEKRGALRYAARTWPAGAPWMRPVTPTSCSISRTIWPNGFADVVDMLSKAYGAARPTRSVIGNDRAQLAPMAKAEKESRSGRPPTLLSP